MKVFAACDDFDSEKQPPACAFPCVPCAPCVLCGEGFWLRLRRVAFQGLGSCSPGRPKGLGNVTTPRNLCFLCYLCVSRFVVLTLRPGHPLQSVPYGCHAKYHCRNVAH